MCIYSKCIKLHVFECSFVAKNNITLKKDNKYYTIQDSHMKFLTIMKNPFFRRDFQKEVRLMAQLKDPNIVRVLGVCTRDEPQAVCVEYMKYGDLNQFLRQHIPAEGNTMPRKKASKQLRYRTFNDYGIL